MDERFKMHRLYSTRLAALVGALALAGWFLYTYYMQEEPHWDAFAILLLIALVKLGAMLYYRFFN